jgi:predicted nucleotidyltransferase
MSRPNDSPALIHALHHQKLLEKHRERILEILGKYGLGNPRLFSSVLHATREPESDIDLLVDPSPETTLMALIAAEQEIQTELRLSVDLKTAEELSKRFRERVIPESRSLTDWQSDETSALMGPQFRDGDYLNYIQKAIEKIHRYSGIRPDESLYETLVLSDESPWCVEFENRCVIRLEQLWYRPDSLIQRGGQPAADYVNCSSDLIADWYAFAQMLNLVGTPHLAAT